MLKILEDEPRMTWADAQKKYPRCFIAMADFDGESMGVPVAVSSDRSSFSELCAHIDKLGKTTHMLLAGDYGGDVVERTK